MPYLNVETETKKIQTVARGWIQEWSFSLAGAVSSTPADDMAPTLLNFYSLITDTLEDLGGDSCMLIHNSAGMKFAAKVIIFRVVYTVGVGGATKQSAIRFFLSINFLHRDLQIFPVKLESRFCCGNLHTIISH